MTHHTQQQDHAAPSANQHASHAGHKWWVHLLMCAPMLAIVGYLMATGAAGVGVILYAVGCMAMMAVMMLFMNHSGRAGQGH